MPVLNGVTRNGAGSALAGVSVKVFRSDNDALVASGTSGVDGSYSIVTPSTGPYYAVAYKAGSPDIAGTTVNTLTAEALYASGAAVAAGASAVSGVGALLKAGAGASAGAATLAATGEAAASAAAMPSGAAGIWYADQAVSSPRKAIPNAVAASPVAPSNLLAYSSGSFAAGSKNGNEWTNNMTVTDDYADGPTTTMTASRFVATNGQNFYALVQNVVAGPVMCCFDVKSNTGAAQTFGQDLPGTSPTINVPATGWLRVATAFTATAGTNYWQALVGKAAGFDLIVDNIEFFAGTVDLGRSVRAGHMLFDKNAYNSPTVIGTNIVDLSSGGSGLIQLADSVTLNTFTCGAMIQRTATGPQALMPLLTCFEDFNQFGPMIAGAANTAEGRYGGQQKQMVGMWDRLSAGWHLVTHRYDGTNYDIYLDNSRVARFAISGTAPVVRKLLAFAISGMGENTTGHQMNSMFFYPTALTDTQLVTALYPALAAKAIANGLTHTVGRNVSAEGDSISNPPSYYSLFAPNASPPAYGANYSVAGSTLAILSGRVATAVAAVPATGRGSEPYIISVLIGANDLNGYVGGAAQYSTDLAAYCDTLRAAGWKVALCTILPNGSGVNTYNTRRALVNTDIRSWVGTHCDAVVDFAADSIMGTDTSYTDSPTYWTDATHPSATGHARLETIYRAVINAI